MKYAIIGGVAGGASVAARLRRLDEHAEIILFEKGEYISYANCGLPYYIGDVIKERERLFVQTPESFYARFRIEVRTNNEVKRIDVGKKSLWIEDLKTGNIYEETFDKLLLSPGAEPVRPSLEGIGLEGIFTLRNVADTDHIKNWVKQHGVKQVVIVGAGFIGLEMADCLQQSGLEVNVVEMGGQVMAPVDFEVAAIVHQQFKLNKVGLYLREAVEGFRKTDTGLEVLLKSGRKLSAGMVLLSIGVRPDVRLAREAGLEIGELGGIRVNEYLQTSHPDIYAVGDAIEFVHPVSGRPALAFLAGPANRQARICADNMAEGNRHVYHGTIGTAIAKVFDLTVGCTGLSAATLKRLGISFREVIVHGVSHAGYYPGVTPLTVKVNFSPENGKLLGAQVAGYAGADKRLEMMAAVLKSGGSVYDLMELDHAYAPPFSAAKDPVHMAGFVADNILSGKMEPVCWEELKQAGKEEVTLINVCTGEECALSTIEGALNIPLNELRERMHEIPADREIITFCAVGLRGYIASRILKQYGFRVRNLTGGLKTYEAVTVEQSNILPQKEDRQLNGKEERGHVPDMVVDACGLQCPGPVMKLKTGMEQLKPGQLLGMTATDSGFANDVQAWAKMTGNRLLEMEHENGRVRVVLEKGQPQQAGEQVIVRADGKTIVVFSDDLDKALAAFVIANGAASAGRKVTLFFTFWGLNVIRKKMEKSVKKDFMGKMFGMMLPNGSLKLSLSKMNLGGLGAWMMRKVMKNKKIDSLEELMGQAMKNGVEFIACQMSMDVMGIQQKELIEGVKIGGVAAYLEKAENANVNLFI